MTTTGDAAFKRRREDVRDGLIELLQERCDALETREKIMFEALQLIAVMQHAGQERTLKEASAVATDALDSL